METHTAEYDPNIVKIDKVEITYDFIVEIMKSYGKKYSMELNPHKQTLIREINGLVNNYKLFGYPYCPCRLKDLVGDLLIDKKNSCPCVYHKKEIEENGFCKCELFIEKLKDLPRLLSTSIHRLKIRQQLTQRYLEIIWTS